MESRKEQYLIATKPVVGLQLMSVDLVEQTLRSMPECEVLRTLAPAGLAGMLADGVAGPSRVIIARMPVEKGEALSRTRPPQVIVERDAPLAYSEPGLPAMRTLDSAMLAPQGPGLVISIKVTGVNNAPLANASVALLGPGFPAQAVTGDDGQVTLTYYGGAVETIQALYVKPSADYWTMFLNQPQLLPAPQNNVVTLTPLSQTFPGFPNTQVTGWGQKAMNLDQIPTSYRGSGVKVAIIDSGAATTHPELQRITSGVDLTNNGNPVTWSVDTVFHGSHCAGVIAGSGSVGVRGFAPDAEVHVCKIFPGGRFSDLISALDFCIERGIDVVNLSLGSDQPSETVEQKIIQAKQAGVACIVAAGNSAGPVQYPASSPNVLAVAAIGKLNEFPPNTYHAQTILGDSRLVGGDGFFAAKFSCFGPEIGVCGPGVAILSSVPNANYAAWDGTSMAAPHITGLAALILAHHPDFQGPYQARTADRVNRLFQILRASARPLNLGDPSRTGAGLPDATRALPIDKRGLPEESSNQFFQTLLGMLQGQQPPAMPAASLDQLRSSMVSAGLVATGANQVGAGAGVTSSSFAPQSSGFSNTSASTVSTLSGTPVAQGIPAANPWANLTRTPQRTANSSETQASVPTQQELSSLYLRQLENDMRGAGLLTTSR